MSLLLAPGKPGTPWEGFEPTDLDFPYKTRPYVHQCAIFEGSRDLTSAALFMQVGTGKSKIIEDTAAYAYLNGRIRGLLIFAPNGVHRGWVDPRDGQTAVHLSDAVPRHTGFYASSMGKRDRRNLEAMAKRRDGLVVLAMNIEALSHKSGYDYARAFVDSVGECLVVVDESQRIKSPGAEMTLRIRMLRRYASEAMVMRRILSGTPAPAGNVDLYSQYGFMDPDIIGEKTAAAFKAVYTKTIAQQYGEKTVYKNAGNMNTNLLKKKLAPVTFVAKKADCLDLPPQLYARQYVEFTDEQRTAYREMRRDFLTQLKSGEWLEAPLAITRMRRLQQIVAGHVTHPEDVLLPRTQRRVIELPSNRPAAVVRLVEDALGPAGDRKTIVWAEERSEIRRYEAALRKADFDVATYYGGTPGGNDGRAANLRRFRDDKRCLVFLANPASGGTGLTINESSNTVFASHGWSYEKRAQAEGRNHRPGQAAESVLYTDILVKGTVEEKIRARVNERAEYEEDLLAMHGDSWRTVLIDLLESADADDDGSLDF